LDQRENLMPQPLSNLRDKPDRWPRGVKLPWPTDEELALATEASADAFEKSSDDEGGEE